MRTTAAAELNPEQKTALERIGGSAGFLNDWWNQRAFYCVVGGLESEKIAAQMGIMLVR
jgi:hypothetical protein